MQDTEMDQLSIANKFVTYTQQHVFLTGKAGTGKTTFLQHIKDTTTKKYVVLAPTGVAAINAGGVTIHSFFQLHFGLFIPQYKNAWGAADTPIINTQQLLGRLKYNANKRKIIQELELIIIDEISMVRADIIDAIDTILQHTRKNIGTPFGGVQMLLIGDLFQLPPVVRDEEKRILSEHYNSPFFFDALAFKNEQPLYIELQKIHRQKDESFIHLLNNIRNGNCSNADLTLLEEHYRPLYNPPAHEKIITLTTHNNIANEINQQALSRLNQPTMCLEASISGDFPEHLYPIDTQLQLKVGAQVMFIKNDKGENRKYFNGKLATIEAIDTSNKQITVSFPNDDALFTLDLEVWNNIRYIFNEEKNTVEEEIIGTFTQFPIKLAWAVTIHKSQGLTFEKAIVDAGRAFAPGQVYVALSRLRSLDGLILKSQIHPSSITTDPIVQNYASQQLPLEELIRVLRFAQSNYLEQQVGLAYNFTKCIEALQMLDDTYGTLAFYNDEAVAQAKYKFQDILFEIAHTGLQFQKQLTQLFAKVQQDLSYINARVVKANEWFQPKVRNELLPALDAFKFAANKISKSKKFFVDLAYFRNKIIYQNALSDQSDFLLVGLQAKIDPDVLIAECQKIYAYEVVIGNNKNNQNSEEAATKADTKMTTAEVSYHLFTEGKSVAAIAAERGLVPATVEQHLISFIGQGLLDVKFFVTPDKLKRIVQEIEKTPALKLKELKDTLGPDITYSEIKATLEYLNFKKNTSKN